MARDPRSVTGESFGVTPEGRLITGMEGFDGVDKSDQAEIKTEHGAEKIPSISTSLRATEDGRVVNTAPPIGRYCRPGEHNLVDDPSEQDHEAVTCTRCPYATLVKPKVVA